MVLGGIMTEGFRLEGINRAIGEWRARHRMYGELKWTKVSVGKLGEYKSFVDAFFRLAGKDMICFRAMVLSTNDIDYSRYHGGDRELGFYKFYYFFLLHSFCRQARNDADRFVIYLDERSTSYRLGTLRLVLNRGIRKAFSSEQDQVASVQAASSHDHGLMQLADILMGAVGYHANGMHELPGASPAKRELARHIAERAELPHLATQTQIGKWDFGIWLFKPGKRK